MERDRNTGAWLARLASGAASRARMRATLIALREMAVVPDLKAAGPFAGKRGILLVAAVVALAAVAASAPRAGAPALGTRVFELGGDSQFFAFVNGAIALGPWRGDLVLEGGVPDAQGIASVTGAGLLVVDVLGGAQGRICRRFESCTGEVYCQGGVNADVESTLDSMGCQGLGGTGALPTISTIVNPSDSGSGAMILTCMVAEANFRQSGAMPDCDAVPEGNGVDSYAPARPMIFTTGSMTASAQNWCGGFATVAALAGENLSCEEWTAPHSGGVLVRTTVNEEQDPLAPFDLAGGTLLAATLCGNALVDPGEACDDSGESIVCDDDCSLPVCGDGVLNASAGEDCDGSFACGPDEICTPACACIPAPICGNGETEFGEDCDEAGESADCNADCSLATCGDGTLNASAGETCETGLDTCTPGDLCGRFCGCVPPSGCGNTFVDDGEECDDGNLESGDGCSASCTAELPFQLEIANLNLLHALFEDNDIEVRLSLAADALAAIEPDIATFQEVAVVDGRDAQDILIEHLRVRHGLFYRGVRYGQTSAGQAVISKWPVEIREAVQLPSEQDAPGFSDPRIFGRAVVYSPVGPLDVYGLHFCASCTSEEREVQTLDVIDFVAATRESGHPVLVGADFNAHRGTPPDGQQTNDPPIERWIDAGYTPFFDGLDAPCDPPSNPSGCTSGQDLRAATDTTTRRIDGIFAGPAGTISGAQEGGTSSTFADAPQPDPTPECAFDPPLACLLSAECPVGHLCDAVSGTCTPVAPACISTDDCDPGAVCQTVLWASDHLGVRSTVQLQRVPEPGALHSTLAAVLALAALRRGQRRRAAFVSRRVSATRSRPHSRAATA